MNQHASLPTELLQSATPPALEICGLIKRFGERTALDNINLRLESGEVLALLGPSGGGKSTLLRSIAGLHPIEEGEIRLGGECVAARGRQLPPEQRRLGMVFQDYALWPHMSVRENVSFPLEMQRVPRAERDRRVMEALSLASLESFADRAPATLSGGQQQRVALARAIVATPRLLLMDEPLSNLDRNLRESLALDIRRLIDSLGLTAVFVTHDQHEAFTLADRIAVLLDGGKLAQIDTPQNLYHAPATPEVAHFLDIGALVKAEANAGDILIGDRPVPLSANRPVDGSLDVLLPRAALSLCSPDTGLLAGTLTNALFQGDHLSLRVRLHDGVEVRLNSASAPDAGELVGLRVDRPLRAWDRSGAPLQLTSPSYA
jgi:iron(III) transport system ATP-binding protein